MCDGGTLSTSVKSWAGTSYGSEEVVYQDLRVPSLFPVNDLSLKDSSMIMWGSLLKLDKCRTRFVFYSSKLAALKVDVVGFALEVFHECNRRKDLALGSHLC
ncbi:HXXXD-type acyl-transferase family protein [Artemisia annua]|uniref:HXXXD-type acyl-transferase family protein n=1 Tax=Artemisia annua TaxID=35608 RepID=A0A2U1KN49_ARTAN|nr:HXXXD-type acyl-transferase family protein [Artemisia annua]